MERYDEELIVYTIPDNVLESKRILTFRRRNWVEGIICAGIFGAIICLIPFVIRVKLIFLVCVCVPILVLNLVGIKDQSVFEALQNFFKGAKYKGKYHLRRPGDGKLKSRRMDKSSNASIKEYSAAEQIIATVKERISRFR